MSSENLRDIHFVKCWPDAFRALEDGSKRFEFRKDDRDYKVGDLMRIAEWTPFEEYDYQRAVVKGEYTGKELLMEITYILRGGRFGVPDGYAVMSVRKSHRTQNVQKKGLRDGLPHERLGIPEDGSRGKSEGS
jgi:hypothetical protein